MALGFFTVALYFAVRFLDHPPEPFDTKSAVLAASCLGLSISANLSFLFPALALAITLTLMKLLDRDSKLKPIHRISAIAAAIWLPFVIPVALILAVPLSHADSTSFYYGKDSLSDTVLSLVQRCFFHQYDIWRADTIPSHVAPDASLISHWIVPSMLAVLLISFVAIAWRWLTSRRLSELSRPDHVYLLFASTLALSLAILFAAHRLVAMPYPLDRTAMFLVVLVTITWSLLIESIPASGRYRSMVPFATAPLVLALPFFSWALRFPITTNGASMPEPGASSI
jgi:hypothetical protein